MPAVHASINDDDRLVLFFHVHKSAGTTACNLVNDNKSLKVFGEVVILSLIHI